MSTHRYLRERLLPSQTLRGQRICSLVHNPATSDARVLKSAETLAGAGAQVLIVAVSRRTRGAVPGHLLLKPGVEIVRVPELSLDSALGPVARLARSVLGLSPTAVQSTSPKDSSRSGVPDRVTLSSAEVPAERAKSAPWPAKARAAVGRFVMRAWGPLHLSAYWVNAVQEVVRTRPDGVLANDANTLVPAMVGAYLTGARVVYDSHELWRHRNVRQDRILAPTIEALIERFCIHRVSTVLTVSPSISGWLQDTYGLDRRPALLRNVPQVAPLPDRSTGRLRELAGLTADAHVIAYAGSATTNRGLEETIDALALLDSSVHLVMLSYGETEYISSLMSRADSAGVVDRVHLVGPVPPGEVAQTLADADVGLVLIRPSVLSYRFALPNKLFESIRAGVPVVAADLPDIRQVVDGLGVGICVDGSSPSALAAALSSILEHGETFRAATHRAAPDLTWEREARTLITAFAPESV